MHKPGELWGLWNLLRFSGQTVETRDILQAYKGRHRQQIEQQIQDDARRQQQQQGADVQQAATTAGAAGTSATTAAKPFKIVVLDQLVGSADEDAGLESVLLGDVDARSRRRHSKHSSAGRKQRSSEDSAAVDDPGGSHLADDAEGGAAVAVGSDVGGIVDADEAWCDESLLEGLMDDLLPQDSAGQRQRQQISKRQRRKTILSDSDEEQQDGEADEEGRKPQDSAGQRSAQQMINPAHLSPVAEGTAEGEGYSEGSMGEGYSEGPDVSTGSADGILQPVAAVDPLLAALEQQGAILHVHRHEKVGQVSGTACQGSFAERT